MKKIQNSKGEIFYGLHFYPGVAEYTETDKEPYRVFLNENTLRSMDPTFAGRPVFVLHVDGVSKSIDEVKNESDGWVVESFFNAADGKHWVKFIVCSERGLRAVKQGMRLSNCYAPNSFGPGGLWNGVSYAQEIVSGEYEHLAIVPNPRYDESVIMTPDEFKAYNDSKVLELKKLSNEKKERKGMLKFFNRKPVENGLDLESTMVQLPKTKREVTIGQLVNEADAPPPSQGDMMVDMGDGTHMPLKNLLTKYKDACTELEKSKMVKDDADAKDEDADEDNESMENEEDEDADDEDKESMENEEDDDSKALKLAEQKEKEVEDAKKKKNSKSFDSKAAERAERLRKANAYDDSDAEASLDLSHDRMARGKSRYGS